MSDRDSDPANPTGGRPADEGALSDRLRDLERRLDESHASRKSSAPRPEPVGSRQGYALAMRLGADFVAGVVLGAAIGWGIDRLFGTSPWGLIVFLLLGFAAGILSVLRTAGLVKPGPAGPDDLLGGK
jgi:ATP synthase protein I